jgi:YYY domain-containing protein
MIGMLTKFSGVTSGVGFNLGLSMVFALAGIGAYGIVYNLLSISRPEMKKNLTTLPILGPLFVLVLSNVEGFLEFIHGLGAFWQQDDRGLWSSAFWEWINLENLRLPPPGNTAPGELRHWWWWRASRVIADYDIFGNFQEVIDEFPFFSFYLGDLHPHVLVLPFVFIALALSLNLFLSPPEAGNRFHIFRFEYTFSRRVFFLGALVFGALGFLNLWDFPWYVVIFAGVHLLIKVDRAGWSRFRVYEFFVLVVALGISGVLAYLPFYISFSSQAGGILPNVINPTRGVHLWIMFGTLFVPLLAFLFYLIQKRGDEKILLKGMTLALAVALTLFGLSGLFSSLLGGGLSVGMVSQVSNPFLSMYGVESVRALLQEGLTRRASSIFSAITLVVLLGAALSVLWPRGKQGQDEIEPDQSPQSHRFVVALVVIGAALVIIPEFFYLRDLFGNRMNTIFKFYYQAWILWALAAAYGSAVMLSLPKSKRSLAVVYSLILAVVMFIGLTYPVMGLQTRFSSLKAQTDPKLVLDGADNNFYLNPDEHAAVDWLRQAPLGTLVEAVHPTGGSYSQYARISMNSGQPALLGWVGHEGQWRGGGEEMGTRQDDTALLYSSGNWQEAFQIIEQYRIVYVVVGNLERTTYDVDEDKFIRNLIPVFQQGSVTIYQVQVLDE